YLAVRQREYFTEFNTLSRCVSSLSRTWISNWVVSFTCRYCSTTAGCGLQLCRKVTAGWSLTSLLSAVPAVQPCGASTLSGSVAESTRPTKTPSSSGLVRQVDVLSLIRSDVPGSAAFSDQTRGTSTDSGELSTFTGRLRTYW